MSELSTEPVLKCKRCGELYTISHLSTLSPDPDGAKLSEFISNIAKMGYCQTCLQARQWYIDQGRLADFEIGVP